MDLPMCLNLDKLCLCKPIRSDAFHCTAVMPSYDCIAFFVSMPLAAIATSRRRYIGGFLVLAGSSVPS